MQQAPADIKLSTGKCDFGDTPLRLCRPIFVEYCEMGVSVFSSRLRHGATHITPATRDTE